MNANTNNANAMISIPVYKYQAILEDNVDKTLEIKELKVNLQAEYNFAEEKITEINELTEERNLMRAFISSDVKYVEEFEAFKASRETKKGDNDGKE